MRVEVRRILFFFVLLLLSVVVNGSSPQMPLSASFMGGDLEQERKTRVSHEKAWSVEEDQMNEWHGHTHEQLSSKIMQTCQEEQDSINSWTSRMHQTVDVEKKIEVVEGDIQSDMGSTKLKTLSRINRLKKMMTNLNEHISRVNKIFSAAHLIAMQDLVAQILMMRQKSLSLRSTSSYQDPAFNPIKTFAIPEVSSFLEIKSRLHTELTTSEESLAQTQQLLDEMLGIVQNLNRVRKSGIDKEDQQRASIKEHGDRIKRDIAAWKVMKKNFEAERNVLAQIRDTIETLLATKQKNLHLNRHASNRLFGKGTEAQTSHANVLAALHQHNELISKVCVVQSEEDFSASATGAAGGGLSENQECVSCLARQARGENIVCTSCTDTDSTSAPSSFTMDDDEISVSSTGSAATEGESKHISEPKDPCMVCIQKRAEGLNVDCLSACDDSSNVKDLKEKIQSLEDEDDRSKKKIQILETKLEDCEGDDCDDKIDEEKASATGGGGGGREAEECESCLARQARGENIACPACDEDKEEECDSCLARQARGENIACPPACVEDKDSTGGGEEAATGEEEEEEDEEFATGLEQIAKDLEEAGEKQQDKIPLSSIPGCDGTPALEVSGCDGCDGFVFLRVVSVDPLSGEREFEGGVCTGCMLVDDGIRINQDNFHQLESLGDAEWCEKMTPTGTSSEEQDQQEEIDVATTGPTGGSVSDDSNENLDLEDLEKNLEKGNDDDIMKMLDHMSTLIETASRLRGSLKWEEE